MSTIREWVFLATNLHSVSLSLWHRIQELVISKQMDKQNIQQLERKWSDERRQKQSLEAQLSNERKQRKLAEEKAAR